MEEDWIRPDSIPKNSWLLDGSDSSVRHVIKKDLDSKKVHESSLEVIGNTPMVELNNIRKIYDIKCKLLAKCEFYNPFGSIKDRIGYRMVIEAERDGKIKPGDTLIEPTSGNTGIGIATAAAVRGYHCIIVIPEKMSYEKLNIIKALGAEIVRTPTEAAFDDPESNIRVAQKLQKQIPNSIVLDQYRNPYNPITHYDTTAEEIFEQCQGKVDYIIIGVGTGGTMTGVSRKMKEKIPSCKIVGVDPEGSILAHDRGKKDIKTHFYEVEGIGYDFFPAVFDSRLIDQWVVVDDNKALNSARELIKQEALFVGGSSGSALHAAIEIAKTLEEDKTVVVILPDSVRNYMTKFLSNDWMMERGFMKYSVPDVVKSLMEIPISQLEHDYVEPCEISDELEAAFERLEEHLDFPIPVVHEENFVGCFDVSFMIQFIEGHLPKGTNEIRRYVNREVKKAFVGESKFFHLHYMFKTSTNVFILRKKESSEETKLEYIGQISKNSFYKQIFGYIKLDNASGDFLKNILRNKK